MSALNRFIALFCIQVSNMVLARNKRKKVAILITSKRRPGGVERRFLSLYDFLSLNGMGPSVLIAFDTFLAEFGSESIESPQAIQRSGLLQNAINILRVTRERQITHLHIAANPSLLSFVVCLFAKATGLSVSVSSVNSSKTQLSDYSTRSKWAFRLTYLFCERIDFLSKEILTNHRRMFQISKKKARVAPCSFLANQQSIPDVNEKVYDLCFVSRLIPKKGVDLLLDALEEIESSLRVRICGDGPLAAVIYDRSKILPQHDIKVGYCEDPMKVMAKSRIFLSLQEMNNYPSQSLLEAMKVGCCVVATDVGETRKVLNEQNSILVSDKHSLVHALKLLNQNPDYLESISAKALDVFDQHNICRFSEYFLEQVVA